MKSPKLERGLTSPAVLTALLAPGCGESAE